MPCSGSKRSKIENTCPPEPSSWRRAGAGRHSCRNPIPACCGGGVAPHKTLNQDIMKAQTVHWGLCFGRHPSAASPASPARELQVRNASALDLANLRRFLQDHCAPDGIGESQKCRWGEMDSGSSLTRASRRGRNLGGSSPALPRSDIGGFDGCLSRSGDSFAGRDKPPPHQDQSVAQRHERRAP